MKRKYPVNTYTITYYAEEGKFILKDKDGHVIGNDSNGRELGRDAWELGAEEVVYDYDLGLDEHIPLIPRHEKYKT